MTWWQETAGVAGIVAAVVSSGVTLLLKYIFQKRIDHHAETLKHDLHKDAINAQVLISERHKIMTEIWRLIMVADGAIGALSGIRRVPTYQEFSERDFEELFQARGVAHGEREHLLEILRLDKQRGIEEWQKYSRMLERSSARAALQDAKNEILLKELYLPDNVASQCHAIVSSFIELLSHYEFEDVPADRIDYQKIKALKDNITAQLTDLKSAMKASLASAA